MIYYETTNAELTNTDYYKNVQLFVDLTAVYCKFLDFTERIDLFFKPFRTTKQRIWESWQVSQLAVAIPRRKENYTKKRKRGELFSPMLRQ